MKIDFYPDNYLKMQKINFIYTTFMNPCSMKRVMTSSYCRMGSFPFDKVIIKPLVWPSSILHVMRRTNISTIMLNKIRDKGSRLRNPFLVWKKCPMSSPTLSRNQVTQVGSKPFIFILEPYLSPWEGYTMGIAQRKERECRDTHSRSHITWCISCSADDASCLEAMNTIKLSSVRILSPWLLVHDDQRSMGTAIMCLSACEG
jgi:hypothetical protein